MELKEIQRLNKLQNTYHQAALFLGLVKQELAICDQFLNREEARVFRQYYHYLEIATGNHFHYLEGIYHQEASPLITSVSPGMKLLDAGCGLGSESILGAVLGAKVVGVDLSQERLAVAHKRLKFYQSQLDRPIEVSFVASSIFDLSDSFDIIHVMDAISHIDPVERLIQFAYEHLNRGGRLIIIDANALNPYAYLRARRDQRRRGGLIIKKRNPRTRELVSYAQERIFTIPSIQRILRRGGFRIHQLKPYVFCPYLPLPGLKAKNISYYVERILCRLPLIRMIGMYYSLIATKR